MEAGKSGNEPTQRKSAEPKAQSTEAAPKEQKKPSLDPAMRRRLRWGIVALAVIVGVIAWLATRGGDSEEPQPTPTGFEAKVVSEAELEDIAASSGHPVYWAGPIEGKELEATESADGGVQVSYLDAGAEAGGGPGGLLTIGSYPLPDPAGALKGFAEREGSTVRHAADGREVVTSTGAPGSVYFASPDGSVQVEVYDPSPARAMSLALSGEVQPIG